MRERGRIELPWAEAAPLLLPGPGPGRIAALGERDLTLLDFNAGGIAWQAERQDLSSAAWTPRGWALGYWDDCIEMLGDDSGQSLGALGIEGRWLQAQVWWLGDRLVLSSPPHLMAHVWQDDARSGS
jgi:hypothetical protein